MSHPSSHDPEHFVVGALLHDNRLINSILQEIAPDDFQDENIFRLFSACVEMLADNQECTVDSFAKRHGSLGLAKFAQQLAELVSPSVASEDVLKNCAMIRESSQRRRLKRTLQEMANSIDDQDMTVTALLDDFLLKVISISENRNMALFSKSSQKDGAVCLRLNSSSGNSELISAIVRACGMFDVHLNEIILLLKADDTCISRHLIGEVK